MNLNISLRLADLINNKRKKWALFLILFTSILALGDYSVAMLNIPTFNQLNLSEGFLKIELNKGGGKYGGTSGDQLYLMSNGELIKFNCWISDRDNKSCLPRQDNRFYLAKKISSSWLGDVNQYKPNSLSSESKARIWWYEASIFGPLKEKRLLQLELDGGIILSYDQQKRKYMRQKSRHDFIPTIFLVFSIFLFFLLQLANNPINIEENK